MITAATMVGGPKRKGTKKVPKVRIYVIFASLAFCGSGTKIDF